MFKEALGLKKVPSEGTLRQRLNDLGLLNSNQVLLDNCLIEILRKVRDFGTMQTQYGSYIPLDIDVSVMLNPDCKKVRVLQGHCLTENIKSGTAVELMSNDYISMVKAEKGTVTAEDMDSNSVVIAGELGKGKIVLTGFFIPEKNKKGDILKNDSIEKTLLLNSIYWLAGKKIH